MFQTWVKAHFMKCPRLNLCLGGTFHKTFASRTCFDRNASAAFEGSAPMTRIPGQRALTAVETPEISPPPPTGTMTASRPAPPVRSLTCWTSSRPTVPCLCDVSGQNSDCEQMNEKARRLGQREWLEEDCMHSAAAQQGAGKWLGKL